MVHTAMKGPITLPTRINSYLQTFLDDSQNLKEDAHLSIYLGKQSDFNTDDVASKWPVQFSKPPCDMRLYLQEITKMIYHWGCPRISERDLSAPQPLLKSGPDYRFVTFLHPRWVFYRRLGSNKTEMDSFRYNLLVLQCLKNTPGINQFLGVVLDDRNLINGFLCELPAKGSLLAVITRAFESGQPVAWERREKWCRQIVQAVAEVHSKGFVIGCLSNIPDCGFALDADDDVVLWKDFQMTFIAGDRTITVPPEYRRLTTISAPMKTLPQTDIYHLGLLLWQIATNTHPFSHLTDAGGAHIELRGDLIQLPSPGEHAPQYLKEAIAACCAENPDRRLPAWKLLEKFPSMGKVNSGWETSVNNGTKIFL